MDVTRDELKFRLDKTARWPYPLWTYPVRLLWRLTWYTVWRLCWKRLKVLRPLILRLFGASVSLNCRIAGSAWIEMPWLLSMGAHSTLGPRAIIYNLGGVSIGEQTVISQGAHVCGGTHDHTDPTLPLQRLPITIGSSVWICADAFVGPGVRVGDGAIVGARAVVGKDIEPWHIVAGNPASFVKKRTLKSSLS